MHPSQPPGWQTRCWPRCRSRQHWKQPELRYCQLLADAAEYASSFAEPPQALSARLIQGELAVQPAVELWLFAALNADQADRIAFCRYARGLSEMLARRAGRKARLTLSRQLAADFTAWLGRKGPSQDERLLTALICITPFAV